MNCYKEGFLCLKDQAPDDTAEPKAVSVCWHLFYLVLSANAVSYSFV